MAANNLVPPESLKQIKPYLTLATQLELKNEKAVAYYLRLYSVQNAMTINKSAPECKKFLLQLMDVLEAIKSQNKNDEVFKSEIVGQAHVERFALRIFEKADDDDRQARFNKNLVKQFYSAGLIFDCLNYFGELSEDLISKKQYAKRKAMYLNKCFQTGETPIPGPLLGEGNDNDEYEQNDQNFGENASNNPNSGASGYSAPTPPTNQHFSPTSNYDYKPTTGFNDSSNQRPTSSSKAPEPSNYNYNEESSASSNTLSPDLMIKAQKYCKFATSALQYEDVQTAIKNLEECLKILKTGNH